MKNIFKENMKRFGTKNLSEQAPIVTKRSKDENKSEQPTLTPETDLLKKWKKQIIWR